MTIWAFIIGMMVGGCGGVFIMCMFHLAKMDEYYRGRTTEFTPVKQFGDEEGVSDE